ncbi:MAG TPA: ATP-binding protein [Planctomycetota bacterium]|nr:ATP-binding protein [Planctomycetota bacterium]
MIRLDDLPIRRRLTLVILATCSVVLLVAIVLLAIFEIVDYRRSLVRDAFVWADLIGTNSQAALAFGDKDAVVTLLKALRAEESVEGARVYDAAGEPFADYVGAASPFTPSPRPEADGHRFSRSGLEVFSPVTLDDKRIGTIAIQVDLGGMYQRVWLFSGVSIAVVLVSLLLGFVLSTHLQRPISAPIVALADAARTVAERRDYTIRAPALGRNEIGVLTDAFNHMLVTIEARAAELQRSNQELEQFAYVAAHDLQEPVRMISSYLQLLERRVGTHFDERSRQYFAYASNGADRMGEMIRSLLDYSRIGRDGDRREPVDTDKAVGAALENLHLEVQRSGATVSRRPLPRVVGDETQIVRLLQNLVSNALKFRGTAPPHVTISGRRVGGSVEIAVADNGIGINPQDGSKLFALFQRLHRVGAYPGTGIGLASCKKIVERHGGRIWFEPNQGGGTVFLFTLSEAPDV